MAKISVAVCMSHSPFLYATPEEWTATRVARDTVGSFASTLPVDSHDENVAKHRRCMRALDILRDKVMAAKPDVLVVFGDDQLEQFNFSNCPALCIFVGEEFSGYRVSPYFGLPVSGRSRPLRPRTPEHWRSVRAHPALARHFMIELVARGFDLAFSMEVPQGRIGHAFMRPLHFTVPDEVDIAVVPIAINCYYGPQPTGVRCYQLGRALRQIIDNLQMEVSIGIIGSGGLWHTPMSENASIDTSFDQDILDAAREGDAHRMALTFDSRRPNFDPANPRDVEQVSGGTGMVLGYGSGTGETRNWIAATAVIDSVPGTVVDYVQINASPVGAGFVYWDLTGSTYK